MKSRTFEITPLAPQPTLPLRTEHIRCGSLTPPFTQGSFLIRRKVSAGIPPSDCHPVQPRVTRAWLLLPSTLPLLEPVPIAMAGGPFREMR